MTYRNAVLAVLLFLMMAAGAFGQSVSYVASPAGVSYGASPSVLSLEIQTNYPRAIVRKNDWTAFQTSGTMRLYQNGVVIATAAQVAGSASVILPFSWNFTSGTRSFYAITTTNPYASGSVSVTAVTAANEKYKVGVVLYGDPGDSTLAGTESRLRQIIQEVAGNRPVRVGGGREVRLVVQLEVPWNGTDTYDFWWYQQFARLCERLQVKWTPLLSPHYVPPTIANWYAGDRVTDMNGNTVDPPFLKFSPSSPVWGGETAQWVEAFIRAMQNDGGINHFGPNAAIDEILVGNEMQYPTYTLTSRDPRMVQQWHLKYGTGTAYPTTFTTTFRNFRAEQLSYAINSMVARARSTFDSLGLSSIGISSKLYPYTFPRADDAEVDRRAGYTDSSIAFLDSNFRGIFAIDSYPNTYCGGPWTAAKDYAAADSRTAKPLYVGEFNRAKISGCTYVPLTRSQVSSAAISGFQSYSVRSFVFFAWNPTGNDADLAMTPEQKLGLGDAMSWVVP
jgi:hypothetical protein